MARGLSAEEIGSGLLCMLCLSDQIVRRAWTVSDGDAKCIFHALLRGEGDNDDMAEHDDYEVVYRKLRELGYRDAF